MEILRAKIDTNKKRSGFIKQKYIKWWYYKKM